MDDDTVDVIFMINVLHHFKEKNDEAIDELKRITKTGGKVLFFLEFTLLSAM